MNASPETPANFVPTVLVVDDELHMRLLIERSLRRTPVGIRFGTRGDEVLERIRDGDVALLLIDYELPGLNGIEALRAVRADPAGAALPVVLLTARGHADLAAECAALRVDLVLGKPFSPVELARRVGELLAVGARG